MLAPLISNRNYCPSVIIRAFFRVVIKTSDEIFAAKLNATLFIFHHPNCLYYCTYNIDIHVTICSMHFFKFFLFPLKRVQFKLKYFKRIINDKYQE